MDSSGKRKRRVRADESLITDFLDLRDSSIVQTGPKRPRGGGVIPLTPAVHIPLPQRRQKGIPSSSSRDSRKKTPLTTTVRDLIESAAEVSALTPGPSTRTILTPTPAKTPRHSPRLSALETSTTDRRVLRSALKRVRPLSTLRKSGREGDSHVSFGGYVTVNEYSPEYGRGDSLSSVESEDVSGAGGRVLEPLEEEGSEEEEEAGESEGSEVRGEEEEGTGESGGGVVGGEHGGSEEEDEAGESEGSEVGEEKEERAGESGGGMVGGEHSGSEKEEAGESEGSVVGGEKEERAGESGGGVVGGEHDSEEKGESEGSDVRSDSEAEEKSEEERSEERLKTPHTSSLKAGSSPQLTTPAYSDFRPVRKTRPSPVRRRAPTRQPGKQRRPAKTLPRPLIKNLFTLFCKKRVTKDAMDLIVKFTEVYLKHASEDLVVFARHAGRKTIEVEDVTLLLRRQRHISDSQEFEYLVNTYLPLEYVEELLPCAVAGKRIVPRMKS